MGSRARSECLFAWSSLVQKHRDDIATVITYETGKPVADARFEVDYSIQSARWFAGEAERIQGSAFDAALPGKKVLTLKQPIGVVAALVPWNLPVAMVARKAGAALAAGCTMVVKPSPETPLSVLTLALLAEEAGFPKGVLNVITTSLGNTPAVSEALCRHPDVKKVTFTGSVSCFYSYTLFRLGLTRATDPRGETRGTDVRRWAEEGHAGARWQLPVPGV